MSGLSELRVSFVTVCYKFCLKENPMLVYTVSCTRGKHEKCSRACSISNGVGTFAHTFSGAALASIFFQLTFLWIQLIVILFLLMKIACWLWSLVSAINLNGDDESVLGVVIKENTDLNSHQSGSFSSEID